MCNQVITLDLNISNTCFRSDFWTLTREETLFTSASLSQLSRRVSDPPVSISAAITDIAACNYFFCYTNICCLLKNSLIAIRESSLTSIDGFKLEYTASVAASTKKDFACSLISCKCWQLSLSSSLEVKWGMKSNDVGADNSHLKKSNTKKVYWRGAKFRLSFSYIYF